MTRDSDIELPSLYAKPKLYATFNHRTVLGQDCIVYKTLVLLNVRALQPRSRRASEFESISNRHLYHEADYN